MRESVLCLSPLGDVLPDRDDVRDAAVGEHPAGRGVLGRGAAPGLPGVPPQQAFGVVTWTPGGWAGFSAA